MDNSKFILDLNRQICRFDVKRNFSDIIFLCVGSNKIIGDSVGPLVGQMLNNTLKEEKNEKKIKVYGNMKDTLNYKNASKVLEEILNQYEKPFMITIDSALGNEKMIERIVVNAGTIQIGNSLGPGIRYDSHINIKGVVGKYKNSPNENLKTLMSVDQEAVKRMSIQIVYGIYKMIEKIKTV